MTRNISLLEAILFLNLMDFKGVGRTLAEMNRLPYEPLIPDPPTSAAKERVPIKLAERLGIFPVSFDPKENRLTLAVEDPKDGERVRQIRRAFPPHLRLSFTVAAGGEIRKAIDIHFRGAAYSQSQELEVPDAFKITLPEETSEEVPLEERERPERALLLEPDLRRANAIKTLLRTEGYSDVTWVPSSLEAAGALKAGAFDLLLVNKRVFQPGGSWLRELEGTAPSDISYFDPGSLLLGREHTYREMSEALVGLVSFLIRKGLESDQGQLNEVITRVRHCKLLAYRLHLSPGQVDGCVLAAWLSGSQEGEGILRQIRTPYRLEEILWPEPDKGSTGRLERAVIDLVIRYQQIKRKRPEAAGDLSSLRRLLTPQGGSSPREDLLEAYLGLLREEEFLSRIDHSAGRILIVDPVRKKNSNVVLRLKNEGFKVEWAPDARQAVKSITANCPDLVISEVNLPGTGGIRLCRALRENANTRHLPFFILTSEEGERLAVECLESGADDFLRKPVDPEVIALKVRRVLASKNAGKPKRGVRGTLEEMSSTDFIQGLSAGEKDVEIVLERKGEKGHIFIRKGEIVHASKDGLEGEEALYRLLAWREGEFLIVPCEKEPTRTIHAGTMSLLMEGARLADEASGEERAEWDG